MTTKRNFFKNFISPIKKSVIFHLDFSTIQHSNDVYSHSKFQMTLVLSKFKSTFQKKNILHH